MHTVAVFFGGVKYFCKIKVDFEATFFKCTNVHVGVLKVGACCISCTYTFIIMYPADNAEP